MKKLLLLCCLCIMSVFNAFSQVNYLVDTAMTTDAGFGGAAASCVFAGGGTYGWAMNRRSDVWLADVFTVPAGASWKFDTVILFGYQTNSTSTTSTFLNCNLQIYNGAPGLGGSVIWGDTVTNVLASTGWTGIYRVDTEVAAGGLNQTSRPIMYLKLALNPPAELNSGTYWLSWSAASASNSVASVPKVLPGRINPPGQQGRQLNPPGIWDYVVDHSSDQGFNKIIKASAAVGVPMINSQPKVILSQNKPNPFSTSTIISFNIAEAGYAKLCVYNAIGQLIATLWDEFASGGEHTVIYNSGDLPAGIYYYQLATSTGTESKQLQIVK